MGLNDKKLRAMGIDFFAQKLQWMPQVRHTYGGIVADLDGSTAVKGLYAAGLARNPDPGVYMGGWATCITATTGYCAGEAAAHFVQGHDAVAFDRAYAEDKVNGLLKYLGRDGIAPKDVIADMREVMSAPDIALMKTGQGLARASTAWPKCARNSLRAWAPATPTSWPSSSRRSPPFCSRISSLPAALTRKESRAGHFREDFPERDNAHWLRVDRTENGGRQTRTAHRARARQRISHQALPLLRGQLRLGLNPGMQASSVRSGTISARPSPGGRASAAHPA